MPRRRTNHRAQTQRIVSSQIRQLRREMNGYAPKRGPINPPVVNLRPYYPLVITIDLDKPGLETILSVSSIVKIAGNQLGISPQNFPNLVVRLRKIQGWAYMFGATTDRVSINGDISSLIPNISDITKQVTVNPTIAYPIVYTFKDYGSLNKPAHFSYVWPRAQQEVSLNTQSDFVVAGLASNTEDSTCHIHLEWSLASIQVPTPDSIGLAAN